MIINSLIKVYKKNFKFNVRITMACSSAANVGISTDLEAAAAGLGYSSFADAVAAYNAQYGTNYTAEEAAAALGN